MEKKIQEFTNQELMTELGANRQVIATARKKQAIKDGIAFAIGRSDRVNWWEVFQAFRRSRLDQDNATRYETEW